MTGLKRKLLILELYQESRVYAISQICGWHGHLKEVQVVTIYKASTYVFCNNLW